MSTKRFQNAIGDICGGDASTGAMTIETIAADCDSLTADVVTDATSVAHAYSIFAAEVTAGRTGSDPAGGTMTARITENAIKRQCKVDELVRMVRVLYGIDAVEKLRAALAAS